MTPETLQQRLLRIQMRFEAHDEHHPDCNCNFCEAIALLSELRGELRVAEMREAAAA